MSHVINYLLVLSPSDHADEHVERLNIVLRAKHGDATSFRALHDHAGGPKRMEMFVYGLAASASLPPSDLASHIDETFVDWTDDLQLLACDQCEPRFSEVTLRRER